MCSMEHLLECCSDWAAIRAGDVKHEALSRLVAIASEKFHVSQQALGPVYMGNASLSCTRQFADSIR